MLRSSIPTTATPRRHQISTVDCGVPFVAALLTQTVIASSTSCKAQPNLRILVDLPSGFALHRLEHLAHEPVVGQRIVVLTSNTCPDYQVDLWEFHPTMLLVGDQVDELLKWALHHLASHDIYRTPTTIPSILTTCERRVLRFVASGWANDRIAEQLCVQEKTVRNTLTRVNAKLGIASRYDAMLYYFGYPVVLPDAEGGPVSSHVDNCGPMSLVLPPIVDVG